MNCFKKIILLALIICLCTSNLTACGIIAINSPVKNKDSDTTSENQNGYEVSSYEKFNADYSNETNKFVAKLNKASYDGTTFLIATPKTSTIAPDDTTGSILSEELNRRNAGILNYYNINISVKASDSATMLDEIKAAVKSGSYYADLIMIPQSQIETFAAAGVLMNLASLPGIDFTSPYFNSKSIEAVSGASQIYGVSGPAAMNTDPLSAVFFNKDIIRACGLEMPYSLVDEGTWTWERFFEYTDALSALGGEYYTYGSQNVYASLADLVYFSCDGSLVSSSLGSYPNLSITSDIASPYLEIASRLIFDNKANKNFLGAIDMFKSGNTMFLIDKVNSMKTLSDGSADWGMVPLPKFTVEQESYKTLATADDALFFGVVPTVTDTDKVANILSLINIVAYGKTADAYSNDAMCFYLRDNASAKMLDIIFNSVTYDFAYTFSSRYDAIPSATYMAIRNTAMGASTIQRYLNSYSAQFDNAIYKIFG